MTAKETRSPGATALTFPTIEAAGIGFELSLRIEVSLGTCAAKKFVVASQVSEPVFWNVTTACSGLLVGNLRRQSKVGIPAA